MPSFPCVHHIEVGVTDGPRAVNILRKNYTFDVVATRNSAVARQWLLVKSDTRYVVTCLKTDKDELIRKDDYVIDWMNVPSRDGREKGGRRQRKDSVFNVCLQVDSIEQSLARLCRHGVLPFRHIKNLADNFGTVRLSTIKSCVGDVYHTLVEKDNYKGLFLPGFQPVAGRGCDSVSDEFWANHDSLNLSTENRTCNFCDNERLRSGDSQRQNYLTLTCNGDKYITAAANDTPEKCLHVDVKDDDPRKSPQHSSPSPSDELVSRSPVWTTFDHVAFAVEMGTSPDVIDWYEKCLGMRQFLINSEEDKDQGLVLSMDNVSLRLRAMEYWKCAETGLAGPKTEDEGNRLSMVIAEGLPPVPGAQEENQIESWLKQHGGPGIQHIALNTGDIKTTVSSLKRVGAAFANPPPQTYYSEVGRLYDIQRTGEDLDTLREHGILIDTEADGVLGDRRDSDTDSEKSNERYLLQIFTKPIFPKDPFFMEIIQREGATGFGSGNVAALYRSVQACITEKAKDIR